MGRKGVCGRQHGHEALGQHGGETEFRVVGGWLTQQADVDGPLAQGGQLRRGGHFPDVQPHGGKPFAEGSQQAGQDGQSQGGGEADPQASGPSGADLAGRRQAVRDAGEGLPGGGKQFPASGGEGDVSRLAAEQRMADLVLQAPDLLAQRRLGDAQAGGRAAEVEFLGEYDERVQLGKGKFGALHTLRDITPCQKLY